MPRMRAIRQETFGGSEVLRLVEVDRPEPIPTEVLVRVHAAGVNPVDWKTRAGGGVGHLAVQIAKARGAHVTATASPGRHDFVLPLAEAAKAHELSQAGHARGKIVLEVA